jgi:ATP:ADP antiporter, AAA family
MKLSNRFFEVFFDIRRQELGRVLLMSTYLLLIIASYSVTKAVRDSLFVTKIGPAQLPYVYLLIAGAMGVVSIAYSRAVNRIGLHRLIRATSLIVISNLLLFWLVFSGTSAVWFYVLYVWVSLFGAITASQFWLLATHIFNPREARRVFSWIGVGGILGGVFGGAVTNRMAHWLGTESLLIVCAGMMALTVVLLERVAAGKLEEVPSDSEPEQFGSHPSEQATGRMLFRQVRTSRHLTMMVLLLSIAVVVEAFIDYEYKFVASQSIASKDQLTAFFGSITFYIGIFSLLFQTLATNRILKRFGVGWAILLLPLGLFVAFLTLALHPALWTAALLQLVDGGFGYSIHRSGMELLFLPIPPKIRNAVKGFIDMFVDRAGRAAGALLLLLFTAVLTFSIPSLSLIASLLVAAWIVMVVAVKHGYMQSFRQALEKKTIEPEALQLRNLDKATMTTLLAVLASGDERQILYALDLLSHTHPKRWGEHIDSLIQHRSSAVRARTLAVLANWQDPAIADGQFMQHPDYETARVATATTLRLHWTNSSRNRALLDSLLRDSSVAVARQAIVTAGMVRYMDGLPLLIEKLADNSLRHEARQALLKFGDKVIPELVLRLSDPSENPALRRRIPKTLALTGKQQASNALIQQLHRLDDHLDYTVLKALNSMRVNSPGVVVNERLVRACISKEREEYDQLKAVQVCLEADQVKHPVFSLLMQAIAERLQHRLERIFRLVGLIYSPNDIYSVYYDCQIKPALRPAAIEFLDNLLDAQLKEAVVPLLEEAFEPENGIYAREPVLSSPRRDVLAMLITGEDLWLKEIATELQREIGEESNELRERRVITN